MSKQLRWTLVQHSGFGYAHKPGFERAVEVRCIENKADQDKIRKAGGLLFDTYFEATNAAEAENFPDPQRQSLYPQVEAAATFSTVEVDGLRVYVAPYRKPGGISVNEGATT